MIEKYLVVFDTVALVLRVIFRWLKIVKPEEFLHVMDDSGRIEQV